MKRWAHCCARAAVLVALGTAALTTVRAAVASAPASESSPRPVALHVEGRNAAAIADQIAAVGPDGLEIIDQKAFDQALRQIGVPTALGATIANPAARKIMLKKLDQAMHKVGAGALVLARETLNGKKHELHVALLERDASEPIVDQKYDLGSDEASQVQAILEALGEPLKRFGPPPPAPEPAAQPVEGPPKVEPPPPSPRYQPHQFGHELFSAALAFQLGGRWFRYSNAASETRSRPYEVFGPPGASVSFDVYPAATTTVAVLRDLGISFAYLHHFGIESKTGSSSGGSAAAEFGGTWNKLDLGIRYRLRLGDSGKPYVLGVGAGYGFERFTFDPANETANKIRFEVPTVRYDLVRLGVDARLPLGALTAAPRAGFLIPVGLTPPSDRVPRLASDGAFAPEPANDTVYARYRGATARGISLAADAFVALSQGFEVGGGLEYARYFSSFAPELDDAFAASGASDQTLELRVLGAYRY